ncbi:M12 family metallo-peptidase [Lentzea sp. NPDC006480]|uniref:InlB B-repeat-containing protein n=1 Tax=Lentzea sp. NPDC006480 TaxID=3157176 RepID=UPI0033B213A0
MTAALTLAAGFHISSGQAAVQEAAAPQVVRQGTTQLDPSSFAGLCSPRTGAPDEREVALFPGVSVRATADEVAVNDIGVLTWSGHVTGEPDHDVTFAVSGVCGGDTGSAALSGTVDRGATKYDITGAGRGQAVVRQTGAEHGPAPAPVRRLTKPAEDPAKAISEVTVMVAYTPAAKQEACTKARAADCDAKPIDAAISEAVAAMNKALTESDVSAQVRLVHTFEATEYNSCPAGLASCDRPEDVETARDRLKDPEDPAFRQVPALRDEHHADLVHIVVSQPQSAKAAGVGDKPSQPSMAGTAKTDGLAFGASSLWNVRRIMAHELGHNFGLDHDYYTLPDSASARRGTAYLDNRGHFSVGGNWYDIMTYPAACYGCVGIMRYSNPDLSYNEVPTGVRLGKPNAANSARVLNLTAPVLAQYRVDPAAPAQHALTLSASPRGAGEVVGSTGPFAAGTSATLTAKPAPGWVFDHWTIDGTDSEHRKPELSVSMCQSHSVTAHFVPGVDAVVLEARVKGNRFGEGGSILLYPDVEPEGYDSPLHTYGHGVDIKAVAVPLPGWKMDHWELDGSSIDTTAPLEFNLDGFRTDLIAHFTLTR